MEDNISILKRLISQSKNAVFFGGAGVSTESGIPDFRSADGIYTKNGGYSPEIILSRSFFDAHTEEFFSFYKSHMIFLNARPNTAHKRLAKLEAAGMLKAVITQNIDGLHQKAGSKKVIELHGSVHRNICQKCGKSYDVSYILQSEGVPYCCCKGVVKPDVVLYEEPLNTTVCEQAAVYILNADLLIVGGTSLAVYPAAGLINHCGGKTVLINKDKTPYDAKADFVIRESIGEVLGW
ncbi:MAG: NAD-dependent protein deacylase [Christensenellales bacterium]